MSPCVAVNVKITKLWPLNVSYLTHFAPKFFPLQSVCTSTMPGALIPAERRLCIVDLHGSLAGTTAAVSDLNQKDSSPHFS